MSSRDPENSTLGSYEDDDTILSGKATILRSKPQARAQSLKYRWILCHHPSLFIPHPLSRFLGLGWDSSNWPLEKGI